ncbi:MAG TPA: tetratricopeptide repeat protein [Pyrinomonadaceae bacterium]|nr:tetratricopeptide repeat protein [Pyrinomonadaceae bacterium]
MSKDNILFAIIGVLLGFIIGFMFANNANQQGAKPRPTSASTSQGNLPPDHPPLPSNAVADQPGSSQQAAMPGVQAAIEKARNEPDNFEAQKQAGEMFYQIQRWDEAIDFWLKANKLKPDDYETIVHLGNAYFEAGKYALAEQWYTSALTKNPNDVGVRTDLGTTFMARTPPDFVRAIKEYRRSLEINPNHEQSLHNIVIAYTKNGQAKEAQEMIARLEKVNPNNPDLPRMRTQLQELGGQQSPAAVK